MPSMVAHTYFAKDVYKKLKPKIKRKMDYDTFLVFSKGSDLFYYQYLDFFHHQDLSDFAFYVHDNRTKKFLMEYVSHILKYRLEKNEEVIASLYGMIVHHVLDVKTHPFIYYQTNIKPYEHKEMELLIDLYMLEKRENMKPCKVNLHRFLFPKTSYSVQLRNLLNRLYQDVYGVPRMGNAYLSCLEQTHFIVRYFMTDRYGIKLAIYRLLSKLPFVPDQIVCNSYANDLRKKVVYFNYEHDRWCHPSNKNETSTASFFDLYHEAVDRAVEIMNEVHEVLVGKKDEKELKKVFDNASCITGKDCDIKYPMKYCKEGEI